MPNALKFGVVNCLLSPHDVILGARSAVFLPFQRWFVIVDEEHESSFKQQDPAHYHARSVSIVLASNVWC